MEKPYNIQKENIPKTEEIIPGGSNPVLMRLFINRNPVITQRLLKR